MLSGLIVGCASVGTDVSSTPQLNPRIVLVDLYHGSLDGNLKAMIEKGGYTTVPCDAPLTDQALQSAGTLWIDDNASRDYQPGEIKAVRRFVQLGGTVICSGQAWSWAYDKKDISRYPLNQLGKSLGFMITGQNIGSPVNKELSTYLLGVDTVTRTDWWPSMVESHVRGSRPLIRDENLKTMAIFIPRGSGRIFIFGHGSILKENPQILLNILGG